MRYVASLRTSVTKPQVLLLAVVLFAFLLRVYRLDEVPPGLFRDEAYNGLDALRVLETGTLSIFFESNTGRDPLFIYFQTVAVALFGAHSWSLRFVSVFVGLLTIPLIYRIAVELFDREKWKTWLGLVAACAMTVSYWHLHASRIGLRAVLLPPVSLLAILFFWRGCQYGRYRDWILSGIALAASFYTYTAGRALPLVFILFAVFTLLMHSVERRSAWSLLSRGRLATGLGVLGIVAVFLLAPLGIYFWTNPTLFSTHTTNLWVLDLNQPAASAGRIAENIALVARMFIDQGDATLQNNLPDRAALEALTAVGFWAGLVIALVHSARPAYALVVVWLGAMLLPSLLSSGAPNFVRAVGAVPPIFLLVALGLTLIWERVLPQKKLWLAAALLVLSGVTNVRDYFGQWATRRDLYDKFDGDVVTLAKAVPALAERYDVIMPLGIYGQPSARFLLLTEFGPSVPLERAWTMSKPLVLATTADDRLDSGVVVLHRGDANQAIVPGLLDSVTLGALKKQINRPNAIAVSDRQGSRAGVIVPLDPVELRFEPLHPSHSVDLNFGGSIRLMGFDLHPTTVAPGGSVELALYWQALENVEQSNFIAVSLTDARGNEIAVFDREPWFGNWATDRWRQGEIVPDLYRVPVPEDAHIGKYQFNVGLYYTEAESVQLQLVDRTGKKQGDRANIGLVTVTSPTDDGRAPDHAAQVQFGQPPLLSLSGYTLGSPSIQPGGTLALDLFWKAEGKIDKDYTVFVHLLDRQGRIVAQQDSQPQQDHAPTSLWSRGEELIDLHLIQIPADVANSDYTVEIGLYDLHGERLPALDLSEQRFKDDSFPLVDMITLADGLPAP